LKILTATFTILKLNVQKTGLVTKSVRSEISLPYIMCTLP